MSRVAPLYQVWPRFLCYGISVALGRPIPRLIVYASAQKNRKHVISYPVETL